MFFSVLCSCSSAVLFIFMFYDLSYTEPIKYKQTRFKYVCSF